jgi:hypothetical protein
MDEFTKYHVVVIVNKTQRKKNLNPKGYVSGGEEKYTTTTQEEILKSSYTTGGIEQAKVILAGILALVTED